MNTNFVPPNFQQRKAAIGSLGGCQFKIKKAFENAEDFFTPLGAPGESDWLNSHLEKGQTFEEFKLQPRNEVNRKKNTIYILPLHKRIGSTIKDECFRFCQIFFYGMKVKLLKHKNIQKLNIDSRINPLSNKIQYNATQILQALRLMIPNDAYALISVMADDLYPSEDWNFVFGLANLQGRTGVFSLARYDPSFEEEGIMDSDEELTVSIFTACKIMIHELCHMFGMRHCIYYQCLMNGSNHMQEASNCPFYLCAVCLRKLQFAIGFDVTQRYKQLAQYCIGSQEKNFQKYGDWFLKRVGFLENAQPSIPKKVSPIKNRKVNSISEVQKDVLSKRQEIHKSVSNLKPVKTNKKTPIKSKQESTGHSKPRFIKKQKEIAKQQNVEVEAKSTQEEPENTNIEGWEKENQPNILKKTDQDLQEYNQIIEEEKDDPIPENPEKETQVIKEKSHKTNEIEENLNANDDEIE